MKAALLALSVPVALALAGCTREATGSSENAVHAGEGAGQTSAGPTATNAGERAMKSYVAGMDEIVGSLKKVEDDASASKAGDTIVKVGARWEKEKAAWSALSEPELAAARERFRDELGRVQGELMIAMTNLASKPGLAAPIQQALQKLPKFE